MLNVSYVNNSMGVDLLRVPREYYPFNYDEEICCISNDHLLTIGHDQVRYYAFTEDKRNTVETKPDSRADSMKVFLEAVMQVTQHMIRERKMK